MIKYPLYNKQPLLKFTLTHYTQLIVLRLRLMIAVASKLYTLNVKCYNCMQQITNCLHCETQYLSCLQKNVSYF